MRLMTSLPAFTSPGRVQAGWDRHPQKGAGWLCRPPPAPSPSVHTGTHLSGIPFVLRELLKVVVLVQGLALFCWVHVAACAGAEGGAAGLHRRPCKRNAQILVWPMWRRPKLPRETLTRHSGTCNCGVARHAWPVSTDRLRKAVQGQAWADDMRWRALITILTR